jgi:CDP-6-deoxy-D-xylo-4-hexulose-3-dehydrase
MGETITMMDRLKMAKFVLTTKKFTNGEKVKQFEHEWNLWLGSEHSLYVSSGSTANFLLVAAVKERYGLKDGDKVLVPACTWVTNVAPIIQLGLQPIFCDINLQNFSFDLSAAKRIASHHKDIRMIFVTHLLGFSGENERLQEIFPQAIIIDDICESHGCTAPNGKRRGADTLGGTFSFYFGHHMSTIEGGMVTTNNADLYDLMRMKRSHGMARESFNHLQYAERYKDIEKAFLFMTDGYNFRNHEVCAVLGSAQLKRLNSMIAQRRENYSAYVEIIESFPQLFYNHAYDPSNSSFCFPFICKSTKIMRAMKEVFTQNGIEFRPVVSGNLLKQPFLKGKYKLEYDVSKSNVETLHKQGVYIGNNHFITSKDMNFLYDIVGEINARFSLRD